MDDPRFKKALEEGRPYFGRKYASLQGIPMRHAHMTALLHALDRQSPAGVFRVLEVGSWAGGSAITWARALDACGRPGYVVCVDSWQPQFNPDHDQAEVYQEMRTAAARDEIMALCIHNLKAAGVDHRTILMRGSSADVLPLLHPGGFDLIFIDGDHTYAHVSEDIRLSLPLLREGGVLCGDDLELTADACDQEAMRQAAASGIDYALDPKTHSHYHPGVTAAVGDELPRVSVWDGFWAAQISRTAQPPLVLREEDTVVPDHLDKALEVVRSGWDEK